MSGLGKYLSIGLLISLCAAGNVWGQATALISGTARDQSGAVAPNATVLRVDTPDPAETLDRVRAALPPALKRG